MARCPTPRIRGSRVQCRDDGTGGNESADLVDVEAGDTQGDVAGGVGAESESSDGVIELLCGDVAIEVAVLDVDDAESTRVGPLDGRTEPGQRCAVGREQSNMRAISDPCDQFGRICQLAKRTPDDG